MTKHYNCAAHDEFLPRFPHAIDEEASELCEFARGLKARTQTCRDVFDRPIDDMNIALRGGRSPGDAEAALEACGRRLRWRWLDAASSAAMAAVLHLLETLEPLGAKRPLSTMHFGAYFETTEILSLFPSLLHVVASGREALARDWESAPEIVLIEPVFCAGKFVKVDLGALSRNFAAPERR